MKSILPLLGVIAMAACLPGQLIVNEINTDATDAFEILNNSGAPVNLNGWRVEYGGVNQSLIWTPGTYNFPNGVNVAPGELIVVRESTSGPPVLPGTQTFLATTNINWATTSPTQTRGGACIIVNAANVGVDQVRWLGEMAPNEFGAAFTGTFNPTTTAFSRVDFVDDDDASDWADEPLALGSLGQAQASSINVIEVQIVTTGIGDLTWNVTTSNPPVPGGEIFNFVSLQDFVPDGSGPFFGIGFDAVAQLAQPASPTGIFHTFLDASGAWGLFVPGGLPAGLQVETVSILLEPAGVTRVSNVEGVTF